MAQYTYKCFSCTHEFDRIMQSKYRDDFQTCPKCKADAIRKKISVGTTFNLVGEGFCRQGMPKKS